MSYRIRYRRRARAELDQCLVVYPFLLPQLREWLDELASAAERKSNRGSIGMLEVAELILAARSAETPDPRIAFLLHKFDESRLIMRLRAILEFLRRRRPWELRSSARLLNFLDVRLLEVAVDFEVDHLEQTIVVAAWYGLPGTE